MEICKKTKRAVIFSEIFSEPLVFFYALLVPIFIKELHATTLQLILLTTLHPVVTFVAMYWSYFATKDSSKILRFIKYGGIFARILWLLVPFFPNPWLIIVVAANYVLFTKGTSPAWSEILRLKLDPTNRNKIFSIGSFWAYFIALILTLCINPYLGSLWKSAFFFSALIGLLAIPFQMQIEVPKNAFEKKPFKLLDPPKQMGHILKTEAPFRQFQVRFMVFGIAMMLIHPVMMLYLVNVLKLNYVNIALLTAVCKGFGSLVSSRYWGKYMSKISMEKLSTIIFLLFAGFLLLIQGAHLGLVFLYIAYFTKGVAQSAIHMIWHLSGPYYSGGKNSALFSSINLVMVGFRGLFAPALGLNLAYFLGPSPVLWMAFGLCVCSGVLYPKTAFKEKEMDVA